MYICRALGIRLCVAGETFGPGLQYGPAAPLDLFFPTGQAGEEVADHPLHTRPGPQAQVPRCLFPGPAPDSFIAIEVRTVAWQVHQPQVQTGCPQLLPHPHRPGALAHWSQITISGLECLSSVAQEGGRGSGVAVALQVHPLHLGGLQAHRGIVAGLLSVHRTGEATMAGPPSAPTCFAVRHRSGRSPSRSRDKRDRRGMPFVTLDVVNEGPLERGSGGRSSALRQA